jgi:ligand-binding sensor domain-containing protein
MKRLFQSLAFVLSGILLIPIPGFSQDIHFDVVKNPTDGSAGDPSGNVLAMTQDKQGYVWFGTSNGLFRYDGFQYSTYRNQPLNPNSISSNYIECLTTDKEGYIWIGHFLLNGGLDRLDPATGVATHFRHNPNDKYSLGSDSVTAIIQGKDGAIWVGTNVGLDRLDTKTNQFFHYQYHADDPGSLSFNQVRTIYEDKEGTIWVGTGNPFIQENPKFEGGLNKLNKKTGKFTRYLHSEKDPHSLIDNRVCAIFEDSKKNFWVGTAGEGLHKMNRATGTFERLFYDSSHPDKLSRPPVQKALGFVTDVITFITEDIKHRLWIGTIQGGIHVYDPATQKTAYYGTGKNSKEKLNDNNFWKAYTTTDLSLIHI